MMLRCRWGGVGKLRNASRWKKQNKEKVCKNCVFLCELQKHRQVWVKTRMGLPNPPVHVYIYIFKLLHSETHGVAAESLFD